MRAWVNQKAAILLAILALLGGAGAPAEAHKPSDSFLSIVMSEAGGEGRWDIALRDLEHAIGLDGDLDGALTWGEIKSRHSEIAAYALSRLRVERGGQVCGSTVKEQLIDRHSDGAYSVLFFVLDCPHKEGALIVDYSLFFDLDPTHRGLLSIQHIRQADSVVSAVLSPTAPQFRWQAGEDHFLAAFLSYLKDGVWHIWVGFDHVLFLATLLLPAFLSGVGHRGSKAHPMMALVSVIKLVTAFSLAHSITLTAGVLDWLTPPTRWVEATIAASVVVAAANNLYPFVTRRLWLLAFVFGLVHGFGFAGVLSDLGLPSGALVTALVAFNIGVELGQLAIVIALLPMLYGLCRFDFYPRWLIPVGSLTIILIGSVWILERLFGVSVPWV